MGWIHPLKPLVALPLYFIKKKDGSLCLVQDYCALNAMTVKNHYPLPIILELINQLQGVKYFTKLNIRWGNNNVCIKKGDEWKAVFHTNRGLFEPLVMFFGLMNSPATFQTMMNEIFQDLIVRATLECCGDCTITQADRGENQREKFKVSPLPVSLYYTTQIGRAHV